MTHYLVVTAIGTDRPGIVNEVTRHVSGCGCNIVDSRLGIFGNEFTFIMLLSGDWNSLMQLEISLPAQPGVGSHHHDEAHRAPPLPAI